MGRHGREAFGWDLPPGLSESHPHFNPPDPRPCAADACDEEVMPGEDCERCGEYQPTDDELRDAAEDEAADRAYEAGQGY